MFPIKFSILELSRYLPLLPSRYQIQLKLAKKTNQANS